MGIQVHRTESQPIPAGLCAATVENVAQETGKFGEQLKVKFLIDEVGFEGKTLTGWTNQTFSPKSKLFSWVKAAVFGGRDIPKTYQVFDADHLLGRRVLLSVDTVESPEGETYNKIKDLLPFRRMAPQPAPAVPSTPPKPVAEARSSAIVNQEPDPGEPPGFLGDDGEDASFF